MCKKVSLYIKNSSEELDSPVVSTLRRAIAEFKQQLIIGWVTKNYLKLLRASEGTLGRWSWLYLLSLAPV
jgi:hypothetical protein